DGRRLPVLHLSPRDRVWDPDPGPAPAAAGTARPRAEGKGVKGFLIALGVGGALLLINAAFTGALGSGLAMPPYLLQIICLAGINIILAVSLNLINGFTGQFSIGHAGFMAIGAYASAYFTVTFGERVRAVFSFLPAFAQESLVLLV